MSLSRTLIPECALGIRAQFEGARARANRAILDRDVFTDAFGITGFQADSIVSAVNVAVRHRGVLAVDKIEAVVVPVRGAAHGDMVETDVLAIHVGLHPAGGSLQGDALDGHTLAIHELDQLRAVRLRRAIARHRIDDLLFLDQPQHVCGERLALAIDHPFASDANVALAFGLDERHPAIFQVVRLLRAAEERRAFVDEQRHAIFQDQRAAEERAAGETHRASASGSGRIDSALDGSSILGPSITGGAVLPGINGRSRL